MSEQSKDGGPAFPVVSDGRTHGTEPGMTLRDYFAAKAMQGIVSSIDGESNYDRLRTHAGRQAMTLSQWIARDAYKQADAMMIAREAKS